MSSIVLSDVTVDVPIYGVSSRNAKGTLLRAVCRRVDSETVWIRALESVSLTLNDGDRLGLIGANGAGKTTLLRVIAGILSPTAGHVSIDGEVAAMFDLNLGMSFDATGRENIISRGMVLGHSRAEMADMIESITEFADLGDRINHPVRTYSSGMVARLSFSSATAIQPEILLLDEGIGMADAAFTARAQARLHDFITRAGILVVASHSDQLLSQFCDRAIVLDRGRMTFVGPVANAVEHYQASFQHSLPEEPRA